MDGSLSLSLVVRLRLAVSCFRFDGAGLADDRDLTAHCCAALRWFDLRSSITECMRSSLEYDNADRDMINERTIESNQALIP